MRRIDVKGGYAGADPADRVLAVGRVIDRRGAGRKAPGLRGGWGGKRSLGGSTPPLPAIGNVAARPTFSPPAVLGRCIHNAARPDGLIDERDHLGRVLGSRYVLDDLAVAEYQPLKQGAQKLLAR